MSKYANPILPKKEKVKTYCFTDKSLAEHDAELIKSQMPNIICYANAMLTAAFLYTLHRDRYLQFGKKRLGRTYNKLEDTFDSIIRGYVNYHDLVKDLEDECKITMRIETPEGIPVDPDAIFRIVSHLDHWKFSVGERAKL